MDHMYKAGRSSSSYYARRLSTFQVVQIDISESCGRTSSHQAERRFGMESGCCYMGILGSKLAFRFATLATPNLSNSDGEVHHCAALRSLHEMLVGISSPRRRASFE